SPVASDVPPSAVERETLKRPETEPPILPQPATSVPTTTSPASLGKGFEESFGTRWVVWIGGLALMLGGYFLVRYTIEQGLLGPGVRVFLGGLFASFLIAAGEWTRRQDRVSDRVVLPTANIPSVLTAAGTAVAFATAYAAYALYGFLDASAAFILLGIVALA